MENRAFPWSPVLFILPAMVGSVGAVQWIQLNPSLSVGVMLNSHQNSHKGWTQIYFHSEQSSPVYFLGRSWGDTSSLTQGSHISLIAPLFCPLELSVAVFAASSASNCSHHQQCWKTDAWFACAKCFHIAVYIFTPLHSSAHAVRGAHAEADAGHVGKSNMRCRSGPRVEAARRWFISSRVPKWPCW